MTEHEKFHYHSLSELTAAIEALGLDFPASDDVSILAAPARLGRLELPNRLAVQPMEGCDGTAEGAPDELTFRRYERFAAGGAGLIWAEATAVVGEGRANPRQLWLHEGTRDAFAELVRRIGAAAADSGRPRPAIVLQLTHSGRYSKPAGKPEPIIAHHSAVLDPIHGLGPDHPLITDEELDALQGAYARAAELAAEAGFDAVDIKACHRYLISELLASHTRTGSRYGGDYKGRTRMLRETLARVADAVGGRVELTTRMNVYDALEYPYGWGVAADAAGDVPPPDMSEPVRLTGELMELGLTALNVTAGNPYYRPQVNRPSDWTTAEVPPPGEHPLMGVARLLELTRQVQQAYPQLTVVGTGYTWLRQYFPHFAAAAVAGGGVTLVGLGRGALAYPGFPADLFARGRLDAQKVCVLCSSCSQIMQDGGCAGCVIRDSAVYGPIYRAGRRRARDTLRRLAGDCRGCVDPPCREACPAGVDVPAFLDAVAADDFRRAYGVLRESLLLAGACGSVCPTEATCQSGCVRQILGESPVPVNEIHQHVAALAVEAGWAALKVPAESTGRKAAVIGAGPAGLACAAELLEAGHEVTIFDRAAAAGGKLASVIPTSRMARNLLQREIDAVFGAVASPPLTWRMGAALGPELTLDDILAEGFDVVCLAFGLGNTPALADGKQRCEGVVEANALLAQLNNHPDHRISGDVAVIGGGNTAADAAVLAKQRGAADVYVLYRRGWDEMPAWPGERAELLDAGVHLMVLTQPVDYVADEAGHLTGVRAVRTRLGEPDASGRRRPEPIPDSEFILPVGLAVEAVGESVEADLVDVLAGVGFAGGAIEVAPDTFATAWEGVFAAGDLVNGGTTVAQALAEGRQAGNAIDQFLRRR